MASPYRIRTKVGIDTSVKVLLEQEFEHLEILSLKILPSQIYTRQCSDYGVIVGRVSVNNGFGIPNAKISVFIPLNTEDELNPIISDLYPYQTLNDLNEDGYRYNLLPYEKQHSGHIPTGTFFTRKDVLTDPNLIQVYDKYFKYTAITNESGDYMIFGVPVGSQTLVMDVDLSDIGEFSLSPQDLVRMGIANENELDGVTFKSSTNLNELPQIININKTIVVQPFWGQEEICELGITRTDFDLSKEANININPTAIFMGSLFSSSDDEFVKKTCKSKPDSGSLCNLQTGPGKILSVRQTINIDEHGRPILENYNLEPGGQVIDENGTWLVDLPMNMNYLTTNEFGDRIISSDPKIGIPTTAKYRFKVMWNQSPSLTANSVRRGYYLVPNIKEYGWEIDGNGERINPLTNGFATQSNKDAAQNSYAFSLDWNDYGDTGTTIGNQMIKEAIDCEDKFYEFQYNKVYSISQLITQYRKGYTPSRIISIKNILDNTCKSENNTFPTNDAFLRFDIIYLQFIVLLATNIPTLILLLLTAHITAFTLMLIGPILAFTAVVTLAIGWILCKAVNGILSLFGSKKKIRCVKNEDFKAAIDIFLNLYKRFTNLKLPNLTYPDCQLCECKNPDPAEADVNNPEYPGNMSQNWGNLNNTSVYTILIPFENYSTYNTENTPIVTDNSTYEILFAGENLGDGSSENPFTPLSRVPQPVQYQSTNPNEFRVTLSLTTSEKLNLFNTKAKYFDNDPVNNPGGGVNQIQVSFNPADGVFHTDNVVTLVVSPSDLSLLQAGNLVSFQNPSLSKDPNQNGYSPGNIYGNNASTGTTIVTPQINVSYTKPDGTLGTQTYTSQQVADDVTFSKFPMDIEYFQVITATTISNFNSLCTSNPNALRERFVLNTMKFYSVTTGVTTSLSVLSPNLKPSDYIPDFGNQYIVFLVRGVDPYSTRSNCSYDLSKLFGFGTFGSVVIESGVNNAPKYHLNQPIIGGFKNVSHNLLNSDDTDGYSGMDLFYDSYHYQPGSSGVSPWSSFTSDLQYYYSSLDNNNTTFIPAIGYPSVSAGFNSGINGLKVISNNNFYGEYNGLTSSGNYQIVSTTNGYGYFTNEIVEGGSGFFGNDVISIVPSFPNGYENYYYAPRYSYPTPLPNMNYNLGTSGNKIIMRSDRLPTSTSVQNNLNNSFALHNNGSFAYFQIGDNGEILSSNITGNTFSSYDPAYASDITEDNEPTAISSVISSFDCGNMVPLGCYTQGSNPNEIAIKPQGDECYKSSGGKNRMQNGCYVFVSTIFLSLPTDIPMLFEWGSRLAITFGACRNVFGHIFTNNWINGTLYAFSLRLETKYTSPFSDEPNKATFRYCTDVSMIHKETNNLYYRCSPWDETLQRFVGQKVPTPNNTNLTLFGQYGGNKFNLLFPTTIIDLGPRNDYIQELVFSDIYDGYVVNKLKSTSYTDVSDVFNLFVISRLTNGSFIKRMISGADIRTYFSRQRLMVDGDYAQSISITSEVGVEPFESANYPDLPGQDAIYLNGYSSTDQVFGVFYESDRQLRDYITPKRQIINPSANVLDPCAFNNFKIKSQKVPFYQWEIKQNTYADNIFGSQKNDWYTNTISNDEFFSYEYQSMDRLLQSSRYFRTNGSSETNQQQGFIYSVTPSTINVTISNIVGNVITVTFTSTSLLQTGFIVTNGTIQVTIESQISGSLGGPGDYTITNVINGPIIPGNYTANGYVYSADVSTWSQNNPLPRVISVGAPFHFYFGLKKGASAYDRFFKKWINSDIVLQ